MATMRKKTAKKLSFRSIVLLTIGTVMAIFVIISFIVLRTSISSTMLKMETAHLGERQMAAAGFYQEAERSTWKKAKEIADRNQTISFLQGETDKLFNLSASSLSPLESRQLNFVVVRNLQGEVLYSEAYDYIDTQPLTLQSRMIKWLAPLAQQAQDDAINDASITGIEAIAEHSGLMFYAQQPLYVSVAPVLSPDSAETILGTVTVGNVLSNAYFERLTQFQDATFTVVSGDTVSGIQRLNAKDALVSIPLVDYYGEPAGLLMDTGRTAYNEGQSSLLISTLLFILIAATAFVFLYYLTMHRIVQPLVALSQDIKSLSASEDAMLDVRKYSDNTEYETLSMEINDLVERLRESRMSMSVFDHILNGMNVYLYVSDPATGTVSFINDKMREHFGIPSGRLNVPCWTLMEDDGTNRCESCPLPLLARDPDRVVIWEEKNERTGEYYRNTDTMIDWIDGTKAHLHHRVVITDIKEATFALTRRMEQQQIMSDITRGFIANRDMDDFIQKTLQVSGGFLGAARALIMQVHGDKDRMTLRYEWKNDTYANTPIGDSFVPLAKGTPLYDQLIDGNEAYIAIDDLNGYDFPMMDENIRALFAMPIKFAGQVWGLITFGIAATPYRWSESDIYLVTTVTSLLSAVLDRTASEDSLIRMSSIAESSPDYISFISLDGTIEYLNAGATKVTGYSMEALMEKGLPLLFDPETLARFQGDIIPRVLREGLYGFELPYTHRDGSQRILSFSAFVTSSRPDGIGIIASDITLQRQMERDLVAAKEEAERSNQAKSSFLSRMSHEIRTPMNAIIGMTNIGKTADDIEKKDYCLDKIDEASNHLLGVINDILDMSKIEANKFELSNSEFQFERMIHKITNIINFRVDEKSQNLLVDLDSSIPTTIISDEQRLAQVITNLLSNATKFTPNDGTIRLSAHLIEENEDQLTLRFAVADTGIGISKEQQARLFRAFEQGDGSVSRRFGGTGLGLAISQKIVSLMGGDIWIESVPNEGARFIFTIKAWRGKNDASRGKVKRIALSTLRVLAVDDAQDVRTYFDELSAQFGFFCDTAGNGFEACQRIEQARLPYDVAFVDWKMPGMDGIELARKIQHISNAPTAIIMISATDWNDIEKEALQAGITRYIAKPLFASAVIDTLSELFTHTVDAPQTPKEKEAPPSILYKNCRLLLAEDIQINREIAIALLEQADILVDSAENGVEAVRMFEQNPTYDMILMDIHMPEMDGYEATRCIRALPISQAKTIPIIAMTANVFREDIERCLKAGMNDHIGKPIDVDEFFGKLKQHLPHGKERDASPPQT